MFYSHDLSDWTMWLTKAKMKSKTNDSAVKSPEQFEEEVRLMAYYLWEEKGSNNGEDVEDWIAAEKRLKS